MGCVFSNNPFQMLMVGHFFNCEMVLSHENVARFAKHTLFCDGILELINARSNKTFGLL